MVLKEQKKLKEAKDYFMKALTISQKLYDQTPDDEFNRNLLRDIKNELKKF